MNSFFLFHCQNESFFNSVLNDQWSFQKKFATERAILVIFTTLNAMSGFDPHTGHVVASLDKTFYDGYWGELKKFFFEMPYVIAKKERGYPQAMIFLNGFEK